jgi:hypothetical protein
VSLRWRRIEAGFYESEAGLWRIRKTIWGWLIEEDNDGSGRWLVWEQTGAFPRLRDAKEHVDAILAYR